VYITTTNEQRVMFISNVIFTWEPIVEALSYTEDDWEYAYSYLRHSEKLLSGVPERHSLIDVVSNLKRAVDHRIRHISTTYKIKTIPIYASKKEIWDILAELEVIKPVMLANLIDIRNAVEHQFSNPPPQARCIELAEFVWYFLRSTDSLAKEVSSGPFLQESKASYATPFRIYYNGNPENGWESNITAFLPKELTSLTPKADYFEVSETRVQPGKDFKLASSRFRWYIKEMYDRFGDDDLFITGKLKDRNIELWFLRLYFRTP
jgi:hypothetical protein